MQFLADHDVYQITVAILKDNGHDVIKVSEIGLEKTDDEIILQRSKELNRILITRDKDFGTLVFLKKKNTNGVVFLRMLPSTIDEVHKELLHVLDEHTFKDLISSFCVVEAKRHRIRRIT